MAKYPVIAGRIAAAFLAMSPVFAASSSTTLGVSANPAIFSANITLTANVSPPSATGTVAFFDGGNFVGSASLSGGSASVSTRFLPVGVHKLRAYYPGNGSLTASVSATVSVPVNPLPGNGVYGPVMVPGASGLISSYGTGAAIADFNRDGLADLAVTSDGSISLLLGQAGGGFRAPVTISPTSYTALSVVASDFNGDGKPDLAVMAFQFVGAQVVGTVTVMIGNGDGTFQAPANYTVSNPSPYGTPSVLAADFNNDGKVDLAVTGPTLTFFAGHGDGTFSPGVQQSYGTALNTAVVADVNGDGNADIVGANGAETGVYLGKGDGTFQANNLDALNLQGTSAAPGDFDGDGKVDLAVATVNGIFVCKGNGDGTFQTPVQLSTAPETFITVGDFNDDGKLDLITQRGDVYYGKGNGTFLTPTRYAALPAAIIAVAGDFNADGRTDLVFLGTMSATPTTTSVGIYYGVPVGTTATQTTLSPSPSSSTFGQPVILSASVTPPAATGAVTFYDGAIDLGSAPVSNGLAQLHTPVLGSGRHSLTARYTGDLTYAPSISAGVPQLTRAVGGSKLVLAGYFGIPGTLMTDFSVGDFNGDGKPDLVITGAGFLGSHVLLGLGNGAFQPSTDYANSNAPNGVAVGDFNGDGKLDFATAGFSGLSVYLGNGDGTFAAPLSFGLQKGRTVAVADLNGDGRADLVVTTDFGLTIFLGNGDGTFQTGASLLATIADVPIRVADFNGDGAADFFAGNLYLGTGLGGVNPITTLTSYLFALGDLNQDGKTDLVSWSVVDGSIDVYLGNGDGTFAAPLTFAGPAATVSGLVVGDFDGDGNLDVAAGGANSGSIYFLKGNGDGTLQSPVTVPDFLGGSSLAAVDLNGDGRADLVALSAGSGGLAILLGVPASASATTTVLSSVSPNPTTAGQATTLTATVTPASATGTVTFYDAATNLGSGSVTGGIATVRATLSNVGARTLTAVYGGDASDGASFSSPVAVQVNSGNPPVIPPATLPVATVGQPYQYNFQVSGGTPPYVLSFVNCCVTGIDINGTGIKGTPNFAGTYSFSVIVTDHAGLTSTQSFQLIVQPTAGAGLNYAGSVDSATCSGGVSGWAADRTRLNTAIVVSLWEGSTYLDNYTALNSRPDVGAVLGDNGFHGFNIPIPSDHMDGRPHTYQMHYEYSTTLLGSPFTLTCGTGPITANYTGSVDAASCSGVTGWAADLNRLNTSITVSLWVNSTQVATVTANGSRPDIGTQLNDNGLHGFTIPIPSAYARGAATTFSVQYESTQVHLGPSFTLTCGSANSSGALQFFPITPCRIADTRVPAGFTGQFGPPSMAGGSTRTYNILSSSCASSIPSNVAAYALNFTVVPPSGGPPANLTTWPAGAGSMPNVSTLNYAGSVVANAAIVPAGANGAINVFANYPTDVLFDITGYFAPAAANGLEFFTVTPCRVADTRPPAGYTGQFGPPTMAGGSTRTFNLTASSCGIPASASAFALNFTVVPNPSDPAANLTTWPTGAASMPNVSTLNYSNAVVANAAIVPAGTNDSINVFVNYPTDVLFDINGYFAPPNTNGLHFYPVTPCRVADTRPPAGYSGQFGPPTMAGGTTRTFNIPASSCGIPSNAVAYSMNFTVVPPAGGPAANLTTWPAGGAMPNVSTLNYYGGVVANAAIVPAGTNGAISVFVNYTTDVLFDINGYFAP